MVHKQMVHLRSSNMFLWLANKDLHKGLGILALSTLAMATYGAFVSDVWLASTQWLLVSVWLMVVSVFARVKVSR